MDKVTLVVMVAVMKEAVAAVKAAPDKQALIINMVVEVVLVLQTTF